MLLQKAKSYFLNHPAKLFLLDGFGALVSGFMLWLVLVNFQKWIGIPQSIVLWLVVPILLFAKYSLSCYFLGPNNWRLFLRIIAFANMSYCMLTFSLVVWFFEEITLYGILYFLIEIVIVLALAIFELWVARK